MAISNHDKLTLNSGAFNKNTSHRELIYPPSKVKSLFKEHHTLDEILNKR